jgi:hypothetical protein
MTLTFQRATIFAAKDTQQIKQPCLFCFVDGSKMYPESWSGASFQKERQITLNMPKTCIEKTTFVPARFCAIPQSI